MHRPNGINQSTILLMLVEGCLVCPSPSTSHSAVHAQRSRFFFVDRPSVGWTAQEFQVTRPLRGTQTSRPGRGGGGGKHWRWIKTWPPPASGDWPGGLAGCDRIGIVVSTHVRGRRVNVVVDGGSRPEGDLTTPSRAAAGSNLEGPRAVSTKSLQGGCGQWAAAFSRLATWSGEGRR